LEDDPTLAKSLLRYLSSSEYRVDWVKNGEEALDYSYDNHYDLYLFDINVPLIRGSDLLLSLREAGDTTPTILISALIDIASITQGFRAGADDYIKKPFDPEELLIRIQAKTHALQPNLSFREFEIDRAKQILLYQNRVLELGTVQNKILITLIEHYPNPVSKEDLFELLEKPSSLALRVNISKIKAKVNVEIKNIRGVGYKIL
jgi:DNA-binding response OmpR family regulator